MKSLVFIGLAILSVASVFGFNEDEGYEYYPDSISNMAMKARRSPDCDRPLDIIFAIDGSSAMGSGRFKRLIKPTLSNVVEILKKEGDIVRMGYIGYGTKAHVQTKMSSNHKYLARSIKRAKHVGGATNLGQALCIIDNKIKFRADADRVVLILSRGKSNVPVLAPCKGESISKLGRKLKRRSYILSIGLGWDQDHSDIKSISDGMLTLRSSDVKKAVTQTIQFLLCKSSRLPEQPKKPLPAPNCDRPLDVMFAIDISSKMGYTDLRTVVIPLMKAIVDLLPRDRKVIRIGFTVYGSRATVLSNLVTRISTMDTKIKKIPFRGGNVNLGHAICLINEKVKFRSNADRYVIVIAKGESNIRSYFPCHKQPLHKLAAKLHEQARVIGYSIGSGDHKDVKKASTEVYKLKTTKDLTKALLAKMKYLLCY